jgi:hypothetical protein
LATTPVVLPGLIVPKSNVDAEADRSAAPNASRPATNAIMNRLMTLSSSYCHLGRTRALEFLLIEKFSKTAEPAFRRRETAPLKFQKNSIQLCDFSEVML